MKNWFLSKKIKQKVRYLFLMIIGAYFLLFTFIYSFVLKRNTINYTMENSMNTLSYISGGLSGELDRVNTISRMIMLDNDVVEYLLFSDEYPNIDLKSKNRLACENNARIAVDNFFNISGYVNSIYLLRMDRGYLSVAEGITYVDTDIVFSNPWYEAALSAKGSNVICLNGNGAFRRRSGENVISLIRAVNSIDTQKPIGILVINLNMSVLTDTYKDSAGAGRSYVYCDRQLNPLYAADAMPELADYGIDPDGAPEQHIVRTNGKNEIVSVLQIPDTDYYLIGIEKLPLVTFMFSESLWLVALLIVMTLAALSVISIFISRYITTPIENLARSMGDEEKGSLKKVSLALPDDEIGNLKDSYNEMIVTINNLIRELVLKEKVNAKLELDALQEQIKPHFLYNTLETIGYFALEDSAEKAYDAIEILGNYYRRFLNRGANEVPLREEIFIVMDYLKLQKMRYGDIFEDEYIVQEDLLDIKIPKLILQPLAENSLYHGVRPKGEKCVIRISVFTKGDRVHITVYDNGIGFKAPELERLMERDNGNSFGLRRTIERIRYFYNERDVYEIHTKEGMYTEIELKIPLVKKGGALYVQDYDN